MAQGRSSSTNGPDDKRSTDSSSLMLKQMNSDPWQSLTERADELDWPERIEVAFQIADQLAAIHARGSLVGNLTADNVLVNNKLQVILKCTQKKHGADIHFFGILLIWLTTRNTPLMTKTVFNDADLKEWNSIIRKNLKEELYQEFEKLILNCFSTTVKNRPTASHLAKMLKPMSIILNIVKARDQTPQPISIPKTLPAVPKVEEALSINKLTCAIM